MRGEAAQLCFWDAMSLLGTLGHYGDKGTSWCPPTTLKYLNWPERAVSTAPQCAQFSCVIQLMSAHTPLWPSIKKGVLKNLRWYRSVKKFLGLFCLEFVGNSFFSESTGYSTWMWMSVFRVCPTSPRAEEIIFWIPAARRSRIPW